MDTSRPKGVQSPGRNRPGEKERLPWQQRSAMAGRTIWVKPPKQKRARYVKDEAGKMRRIDKKAEAQ